jgi:anti-anti-sigma regulatory factor
VTPFNLAITDDSVRLTLHQEVTIEHARDLHRALAESFTAPRNLTVDATALTRIDTAGLQVLWAAARVANHAQLAGTSPAWSTAVQRHALVDLFPLAMPSTPSPSCPKQ